MIELRLHSEKKTTPPLNYIPEDLLAEIRGAFAVASHTVAPNNVTTIDKLLKGICLPNSFKASVAKAL